MGRKKPATSVFSKYQIRNTSACNSLLDPSATASLTFGPSVTASLTTADNQRRLKTYNVCIFVKKRSCLPEWIQNVITKIKSKKYISISLSKTFLHPEFECMIKNVV